MSERERRGTKENRRSSSRSNTIRRRSGARRKARGSSDPSRVRSIAFLELAGERNGETGTRSDQNSAATKSTALGVSRGGGVVSSSSSPSPSPSSSPLLRNAFSLSFLSLSLALLSTPRCFQKRQSTHLPVEDQRAVLGRGPVRSDDRRNGGGGPAERGTRGPDELLRDGHDDAAAVLRGRRRRGRRGRGRRSRGSHDRRRALRAHHVCGHRAREESSWRKGGRRLKGRQKAAEATTAWKKKSAEKKSGEEEERRGEGLEEDVSREPNESSVSFSLLTSAQMKDSSTALAGEIQQQKPARGCKRLGQPSVNAGRSSSERRSPRCDDATHDGRRTSRQPRCFCSSARVEPSLLDVRRVENPGDLSCFSPTSAERVAERGWSRRGKRARAMPRC